MSRSPVVPRRRLGVALRQLREQARKSLDDAARILECSASKVSRLETGKGVPRSRDIRELIILYGTAAEARRDELLELATEGQRQAWWTEFNDVIQGDLMADHLRRYVELEADASTIKAFEPELVHGLLQTEGYAHAICRAFFPLSSADERARFVEFRMRRQDTLRAADHPLQLRVLTGEGALQLPIGGEAVMIEQLRHLLELINDETAQARLSRRAVLRWCAMGARRSDLDPQLRGRPRSGYGLPRVSRRRCVPGRPVEG